MLSYRLGVKVRPKRSAPHCLKYQPSRRRPIFPAKRIESGEKVSGQIRQAAPSASRRNFVTEDGKRRYNTEFELVKAYGQTIVFGEHANKLLAELEAKGATFDDVDEAFGKERGTINNRTKSRDEVFNSVRQRVEAVLEERRKAELTAKYGDPESLCGGEPHPDFKSKWVSLSREFVEGIVARCHTIVEADDGTYQGGYSNWMWRRSGSLAEKRACKFFEDYLQHDEFSYEGYGVTLQKQVEDHVTAKMLKENAENVEQAEELRKYEIGVWIDGGTLEVSARFQHQINKQIAKQPVRTRLWDAVNSIRDKLAAFDPETVAFRIRQLAYSARSMSEDAMRENLLRYFAEVPL
jgi:hypothetical protein